MAPKPTRDEKPAVLSDTDRAALDHAREELEEHKHRQWLFASIGRAVKWLLACIAFIVVVWDFVIRLIKSLAT